MTSRKQRNRSLFLKWFFYSIALLLATALQAAPYFLQLGGVRPLFILPLCVVVAIFEGEYAGALFGVFGGLLWDFTAGRVAGLLGILLLAVCFGVSLLMQLYLRLNTVNVVLVNALAAFVILSLDFLFYYWMPQHAGAAAHYKNVVLPMVLFTAVLSPFALLIVRFLHNTFAPTAE